MIWIALAAQLSAPVPTNLTKWAAPDDVPVQLIPEGPNLAVGFRIVVDPAGKPQDCHIDSSSGIKNLDSYTCKLVMRRARFQPATDELGRPMFGAYKSFLSWWVGEKGPPPPAPFAGDLDLLVNALPAGTTSPITVRVMFAVDPNGRASSCLSAKQQPEPAATLVKLACEQVSQQTNRCPSRMLGASRSRQFRMRRCVFQQNSSQVHRGALMRFAAQTKAAAPFGTAASLSQTR